MANALVSNINFEHAARSVTAFALFRGYNYYFSHERRQPRHSLALLRRTRCWLGDAVTPSFGTGALLRVGSLQLLLLCSSDPANQLPPETLAGQS